MVSPFMAHFCSLFCHFNGRPSLPLLTINLIPDNTVLPKISICLLPFPTILQKTFTKWQKSASPPRPTTQLQTVPQCWLTCYTNLCHDEHSTKDFDFTTLKLKSCHALKNQGVCYVMVGTFCLVLSSDMLCSLRDNLVQFH